MSDAAEVPTSAELMARFGPSSRDVVDENGEHLYPGFGCDYQAALGEKILRTFARARLEIWQPDDDAFAIDCITTLMIWCVHNDFDPFAIVATVCITSSTRSGQASDADRREHQTPWHGGRVRVAVRARAETQ
jgi:hypothetical protein